jgi:hypothetical protein
VRGSAFTVFEKLQHALINVLGHQVRDGFRLGVEIKRSDAPRLTPSMRNALRDLKLDLLWVIYPGTQSYTLQEKVIVMRLADIGTQRAQS